MNEGILVWEGQEECAKCRLYVWHRQYDVRGILWMECSACMRRWLWGS